MPRSTSSLLVLAGAMLWGTTGTAQALAPDSASTVAVGALRLVTGGMLLLLWAGFRGTLDDPRNWQRWPVAAGSMSMALYQLCFFAAVDRTGIAVGTIVTIGSAPVLSGILDWRVRGLSLTNRWMVSTALAMAGCTLLTFSGEEVDVDFTGILLAIAAGGMYATYALASKSLLENHPPEAVVAWLFGIGGLLLAPFLLIADISWILEPAGAAVVLHLGVVTVALSYTLFAHGLRHVAPSTAVTLSLVEPLTASLLGVIVIGEHLSIPALAGIVLLITGLWWLSREETS